jgi:hypothetical protein
MSWLDGFFSLFHKRPFNQTPYTGDCRLHVWVSTRNCHEGVLQSVQVGEVHLALCLLISEEVSVVDGTLPLGTVDTLDLDPDTLIVVRARRGGMVPWEYVGPMRELERTTRMMEDDAYGPH